MRAKQRRMTRAVTAGLYARVVLRVLTVPMVLMVTSPSVSTTSPKPRRISENCGEHQRNAENS